MTCLPLTATPGGCLVVRSQSLVLPARVGVGCGRGGEGGAQSQEKLSPETRWPSPTRQPGLLTPLAPEASDATHAS